MLTARSRPEKGETAAQKQRRVEQADAQLPQAARRLSELVLGPAASELKGRRLVVVADGALQYIPFGMLPAPGDAQGRPLVFTHEISALPSASALAAQRKALAGRRPAPQLLAVIADPVFASDDRRVKASADAATPKPSPAEAPDSTRLLEHIAGAGGGLRVPRLPFSRQEAEQILLAAPRGANLKALDFKASRATVTGGELSRYRYVHFATHGYLDSERPGLSAVVLSLVDERGRPTDGFLRANEIYNLTLAADLVVLSACQTGLGKEIRGEGLDGITRGFMYAGAPRVVVSLWSVSDKATAELMARFYKSMLRDGERPSAALRAAQVEMWRQKQWSAPFYWAAFALQGEWR